MTSLVARCLTLSLVIDFISLLTVSDKSVVVLFRQSCLLGNKDKQQSSLAKCHNETSMLPILFIWLGLSWAGNCRLSSLRGLSYLWRSVVFVTCVSQNNDPEIISRHFMACLSVCPSDSETFFAQTKHCLSV